MIIETVTPPPSPPLKPDKHPLLVDRCQNQHQRRNFHHRAKSDIPKLMLLNESDSFTSSDEEVDDDDDNDDDEDNHSKKNPTTSAFAAAAVRSRKPRLPPSYHDQHHQHRRHRSFHRRTGSDIILSKAQLDHLLHESPPQDDQNKPHPLQKQHQHPLDGQNVLERNQHLECPSSSMPNHSARGPLLGKPPLMPTSYSHHSSTPPSPTVSYSRTLSHLHATLQMRLHQHGAYHPQVAEIWNKLGNYFFRSRAAEEQQQRAMDCYLEAVRCCKYHDDDDALVVNENGKSNSNSDEHTNITSSSPPATPTLLAVRSASPCSSNYNRERCDCNDEEDKKDDDDNHHQIDVETGIATNSALSTTMTTLKAATLQQLAVAYRNMSAVFWATDEINTAISYLHKALDVYESRSSVFNTPKTGDDSSASEPCALSAKMEKQLLLSQVSIASTYYQLGLALTLHKDYDAALDALWQSKSIRERLFHARTFANTSSSTPTDDPEIARIIDAIGKVFYHQGNFDAALQCHRDALQMKRKAAAKATDVTARKKMNNLVNGDATEPAISSSSTTQSNVPNAPNASTASTTAATTNTSGIMSSLMNIAAVHHARGDLSRAIRIYEKQVLPMQMSALAQGRLQRHHKSWYHVRAAMDVGETLLLLSDLYYDCYFNDEIRNNTNSTNNNIGNMIAATLNSSINSITGTTNNQHLDEKLILAQRMCRETIFVYREAGLKDNHSQMIMALQRLKRFHQLLQRQ